jgi:hypothetical protein
MGAFVDNSTLSLSERHLDVMSFAMGGIDLPVALAISPRILRCSLHEMATNMQCGMAVPATFGLLCTSRTYFWTAELGSEADLN